MRIRPQIKLNFIFFILGLTAIVLMVFLWPRGAKAGTPVINAPTANKTPQETYNKYEKFELTIPLAATYDDPYRTSTVSKNFLNPEKTPTGTGIKLDAYIKKPDGSTDIVPGFYNVDYTPVMQQLNHLMAITSGAEWMVRYSPRSSGSYSYYLKVTDRIGTSCYPTDCAASSSTTFSVNDVVDPSAPHGFLVNGGDGYLKYEDGTSYTQFGNTGLDPSELANMADNGGNFLRWWLSNDSDVAKSIFRNTLNPWQTSSSSPVRAYDSSTHRGTGYESFKVDMTSSLASGNNLIDQGQIGALSNICYSGSVWVKADSNFTGQIALKISDNKGIAKTSSSFVSAPTDWVQLTIPSFKTGSSVSALDFKTFVQSTMASGTVHFDEAALYVMAQDASGNCTANKAYQSSTSTPYNMIWDPSFEMINKSGNPSQLDMPSLGVFQSVLDEAAKDGIVVQACIFDHRVWGNTANDHSNWAEFFGYDPAVSGSPNFWTDSFWREYETDTIRYLIGRYGYSPALGLWELGNEMSPDYMANGNQDELNWIKAMLQYFKNNDYAKHLVTNSYWYSPTNGSYGNYDKLSGMPVSSVHYYINDETRVNRTLEPDEYSWAIQRVKYIRMVYDKTQPWISGEFGLMGDRITDALGTLSKANLSKWDDPENTDWPDTTVRHDITGIFFHNATWSILMASGFQTGLANWWNTPFNAWNYAALNKAPKAFSLILPFRDTSAKRLTTYSDTDTLNGGILVTSSNSKVRVLGDLLNDSAYLWVQNADNTWGNRVKDGNSISNQTADVAISGFSVSKSFSVKYVNTYNGNEIKTDIVSSDGSGKLKLVGINLGTDTNVANSTDSRPDVAITITDNSLPPARPNLLVSKIADHSSAAPGENIVYSVNVSNGGGAKAVNIVLTDPIDPSKVTFVSADNGGTFSSDTNIVRFPAFDLDLDKSNKVTFTVKVNSGPSATVLKGNTTVTIEAENGTLTGNMVESSDGTYINIPDGGGNGSGDATYQVDATASPGTYILYARGYWPDTGSNSFGVYLDSSTVSTTLGNDTPSSDIWPYDWHWVKITLSTNFAGIHQIRINGREDGAQLDKIILTTDANFTPV